MKFKFKPEKSNLFFMSSTFVLCLITCLFWLSFREYIYFIIYFSLTLLLAFIYYFKSYIIKEKYFIIRYGFINIKLKYSNIKSIKEQNGGVKIYLNKINFVAYPANKDIFIASISSKIDK